MEANKRGRRRFLRDGAALAALAIGKTQPLSAQIAEPRDFLEGPRTYGERSRFETALRNPTHTPVGDSVGIITPSALHFVNNHSYNPPDIDPQQHRLMIHGMVERPLIFTMEELKRLPSVSRVHFIECAGNSAEGRNHDTIQETHGFMSCSEWTGVLLSVLLREAGVQEGARWVPCGRRGHAKTFEEYSAGEGDGRCSGRLRAKWRGYPTGSGLSAAPGHSRLGRNQQRQVVKAAQGCRRGLYGPDGKPPCTSSTGQG